MSFRKTQAVLETKKSIAHLLRLSELACAESKALPEHRPGRGQLERLSLLVLSGNRG